MADLIRREKFLGGEKIMVGDKTSDLVLESLGKIYIKYGNSSRLLSDMLKTIETAIDKPEEFIIFLNPGQSLTDISYPGDGKFVFSSDKKLYITESGEYIPITGVTDNGKYVKKSGDTMTGQLNINLENTLQSPLTTNSKVLVKNLNAEYLNGKKYTDFLQKQNDENITGNWNFNNITIGNGKVENSIYGDYWEIDSNTNTLIIDNVIVRKSLKLLYETAESVYNSRINSTSGNLWISNTIVIVNVTPLSIDEECPRIEKDGKYIYYSDIYSTRLASGYDSEGNLISTEERLDLDKSNLFNYFQGDYYEIKIVKDNIITPKVNEIYRCQINGDYDVRYYDCVITNIVDGSIIIRLSETINDIFINESGEEKKNLFTEALQREEDWEIGRPQAEDKLTLIGNVSLGGTGIVLSYMDNSSPAISVRTDSYTPDYQVKGTLNSQIGVLENIKDNELNPNGTGVYTKRLFAKTGNWSISNGEIKYLGQGATLGSDGKIEYSNTTNPFGVNISNYLNTYIQSSLKPLKDDINTLNTTVGNLSTSINDLRSSLSTINTTINNLSKTVTGLSTAIADLENRVTEIESSLPITKDGIVSTLNSDNSPVKILHHWEFVNGVSNTKVYE